MTEKFLDKVYAAARDPQSARDVYDDWAASYDAEIAENGYATPRRCAEALRAHLGDADAPILDYGCGTGLSGAALRAVGFGVIDGADPSPEMLARAREKDLYRALQLIDADAPAAIRPGTYRAIAAMGVIGAGAAPCETLDLLMRGLGPGALLVFSFNDHTLAEPRYEGRLNQWLDCGAARLLHREHGDHLPGQNMKSTVYVVEKA